MKPEVVMNEAVPPEVEISVPSAGWTDEKAFHPEEGVQEEPFAPTPQVREPEDETFWEQEEIAGRTVTPKPTLDKKARQRKESGKDKLMKSEAVPAESRTKDRGLYFSEDEAPAEEAKKAPEPEVEDTIDRLGMETSYADVEGVLPEPSLMLSLAVEDVDFAREDVQGIIEKIGGALVKDDRQPENIVMAEIASEKVDGFLAALESVGEIKSKSLMEAGGQIVVRIELLEEPTPAP